MKPVKQVEVAAAVLWRADGCFLLGQRAADTFYPGYWEFPGGKVEAGETPRQTLERELREELGIAVQQATPWITREHTYEHAHVRLHFFRVTAWQGELVDHVHAALRWQRPEAPDVGPMLPANAPVLRALSLPNFYAITQASSLGMAAQIDVLQRALVGGLRLVQLREVPWPGREDFLRAAVALCRNHGARVLLNAPDVASEQLAMTLGVDGLHLPAARLRHYAILGQRLDWPLLAASCHDGEELRLAAQLDCDFAVLGPVEPTASHPGRPALGWSAFAALLKDTPLPVYALGGLSGADLPQALLAGAQGVAAIRAAWAAD